MIFFDAYLPGEIFLVMGNVGLSNADKFRGFGGSNDASAGHVHE